MEKEKIERINALARKQKAEEREEQKALRAEYLLAIRKSLTGTLENTVFLRPDGTQIIPHKK